MACSSALLNEHDHMLALRATFGEHFHAPITDEQLLALYSRSRMTLGVLEVHDLNDPSKPLRKHLHLRDFEAPMAGALYCTGYVDELAEMFEPDEEVIVYRDEPELVEKVAYYLSHPEQADRVRKAGRARALRDHTYHQRFRSLFAEIGIH
jgi:hypothetical protein